jgi:hypothetical protein
LVGLDAQDGVRGKGDGRVFVVFVDADRHDGEELALALPSVADQPSNLVRLV